jgi:phosphoglycolate phosphatase
MVRPQAKTIIWDLDGTILDSFNVQNSVLEKILPKYGRVLPDNETRAQNYHGTLNYTINALLGGNFDPTELETIVGDFLRVQNELYDEIDHHIFTDALNLAKRAHRAGLRQIIVTNRDHAGRLKASPRYIVENSSFKPFINEIVCGDECTYRKPDVRVLEKLSGQGWIKPDQTIVIGDQFVDAELARNLNTKAVLVCRDAEQPPHLDRLGDNWASFVELVRSLDQVML